MRECESCRELGVAYVVLVHLPLCGWFRHACKCVGGFTAGQMASRFWNKEVEEPVRLDDQGDIQHVVV